MKIITSIVVSILVGAGVWYSLSTKDATVPEPTTPPVVAEPADIQIIAFGDSLTAGLGLSLNDSCPSQLEIGLRELGYDVDVINSGVSGETTAGNTLRADFIRAQNPDIVILGIGGNDALRFLPVQEAEMNLRSTLSTLLSGENPPEVLLLSIQAPSNAGSVYKSYFDEMYPRLASEFKIPLIPFIVEEVSRNPDLLQSDGIHPTKRGYELLVEKYILPAVEVLLVN